MVTTELCPDPLRDAVPENPAKGDDPLWKPQLPAALLGYSSVVPSYTSAASPMRVTQSSE